MLVNDVEPKPKPVLVLFGISGRVNAFLLALYNLKAVLVADSHIRNCIDVTVLQQPFLGDIPSDVRLSACADEIASHNPIVVGLSCYIWNIHDTLRIAQLVKRRCPNAVLVAGGPEISRDYVASGAFGDDIDFCVNGEGEVTFTELVRHILTGAPALASIPGLSFRDSDRRFAVNHARPPLESLSAIPSPFLTGVVDDDVLQRNSCEANIETQRGCNLKCAYCIYHKDMDRISYTSSERTIDEVTYLANKGVRRIRLVDANLGSDPLHAKALFKGLIDRAFRLKLTCELIPGFLDEELAALMGEFLALDSWNDIRLGIGVQSIHEFSLKVMRRNIRPKKFMETFALMRKHNIFAKVDIIVGLPGETADHISETLQFMMTALEDSSRHLLCAHIMRGLPGTELLEIARRHGMVFASSDRDRVLGNTHDAHELLYSPTLPRADFVHTLRRTAIVFWLVNSIRWADEVHQVSAQRARIKRLVEDLGTARGWSRMAVVDFLVDALTDELGRRGSRFADPEFPRAETWWWESARDEIDALWVIRLLEDELACGTFTVTT